MPGCACRGNPVGRRLAHPCRQILSRRRERSGRTEPVPQRPRHCIRAVGSERGRWRTRRGRHRSRTGVTAAVGCAAEALDSRGGSGGCWAKRTRLTTAYPDLVDVAHQLRCHGAQ